MKNNYPVWWFVLLSTAILFSCGNKVKQFSESEPYAVELARVRSYYHAQKIENRLQKMEIPAYMILLADEMDESSKWYVLLTGAEKDTIEASKLKVELNIQHQLKKLQVLNYNSVKKYLLPLERKKIDEVENIEASKPDLPENIYELVEKFPKSDLFNVENVALFNFPDAAVPRRFLQNFYNARLDLPRGISKSIVASKSEAFAEVIYKDNLYGDRVTVDVLKLAANHGIDEKPRARLIQNAGNEENFQADLIAWYFASLILNTGNYLTEDYEKIVVNSYTLLYGYKVVIEPKRDYLRTYMILVDMVGGFVIFSQSTDKSDQEILDYLAGFGVTKGMLDYSEFHNTFFTIPKCLEKDDVFLGYSSEVLTNAYAESKGYEDWAKAMVGHPVSTAHFYNKKFRDIWDCSAFDLITSAKKDYIYNDMYRNKNYSGREAIKVNESNGFFVRTWFQNEVNFATSGRHVFAVNSISMNKTALLKRAEKFQTGEAFPGKDPCDTGKNNQNSNNGEPSGEEPVPPTPEPTDPPEPPTPEPTSPPWCGEGQIVVDYDTNDKNYRSFQLETVLYNKSDQPGRTPGKTFELLLQQAGFVMPSTSTESIANCKTVKNDLTLYKENPVLVKINRDNYIITGYSLPGHTLHPCKFTRTIQEKNGKIYILTKGETTSSHPAVSEWRSSSYWRKADNKLLTQLTQ